MPVAEFPGRFGWGYDGVNLFAPTRLYGEPDDLRRFVDGRTATASAVILDVVYNHFGPDGNYLRAVLARTTSPTGTRPTGASAINFDGPGSGPGARVLPRQRARTGSTSSTSTACASTPRRASSTSPTSTSWPRIGREVRAAARGRETLIVAENEPQHTRLVRPLERGGYGLDALWNDDFHHTAMVALTGKREAYYTDYRGTPQELISAVKWGYLYQGQRYKWQRKPPRHAGARSAARGRSSPSSRTTTRSPTPPTACACTRSTSPGRYRAMTALLLLGPATPMLFQGQEFASSAAVPLLRRPPGRARRKVREGRAAFLTQFPSIASPEMMAALPDPSDPRHVRAVQARFRRARAA